MKNNGGEPRAFLVQIPYEGDLQRQNTGPSLRSEEVKRVVDAKWQQSRTISQQPNTAPDRLLVLTHWNVTLFF